MMTHTDTPMCSKHVLLTKQCQSKTQQVEDLLDAKGFHEGTLSFDENEREIESCD